MEHYNGLYQDVRQPTKRMCENYLASNLPVNVGTITKTKPICQNIREGTDISLAVFNALCNCQAAHLLWVVAGGFASYITKHTKTYSDVDIFVRCSGDLKPETFAIGNVLVTVKWNVVTLLIKKVLFQVIQVPFSICPSRQIKDDLVDMFALHVLANFDLPICRVAVKYDFVQRPLQYVVDLTSIDFKKDVIKHARQEKYNKSQIAHPIFEPPSLKALCLFNLLKQ